MSFQETTSTTSGLKFGSTHYSIHSGEILFVKSVKDGIPNRDPLNDSNARRLFGEDDGRISLSDVSIKRDVRDYVLDRYPDGGEAKNNFVFVRPEYDENGKLLNRDKLAQSILKRVGEKDADKTQAEALFRACFDMRVFGAVFSVSQKSFHETGPVQFGWAHSLHPVETKYVQGTVTMPSDEGKAQGTVWTTYTLPFAVFAMPAIINAPLAAKTGASAADIDLLLEGLWRGTLHRQARGRGIQQPLLLIHVEYTDPFYRLGYLDEKIHLNPGREVWLGPKPPTTVGEVDLDLTRLSDELQAAQRQGLIARIRYWAYPDLKVKGTVPGEAQPLWR